MLNISSKKLSPGSILTLLSCLSSAPAAHSSLTTDRTHATLQTHMMDHSANPCTDFFNYANGTWLTSTSIPPDSPGTSTMDEITERNLLALKKIAELAANKTSVPGTAEAIIGAYYFSGMDESAIETAGATPIADGIAQINAINDHSQLMTTIAALHKMGATPLFFFYVTQDMHNSQRYLPQLAQGGLNLPDNDYYLRPDPQYKYIRNKYHAHIAAMFSLLGDTPAQARKNANTVLRTEIRLAQASTTQKILPYPLGVYHLMHITDLNKIARNINWGNYFRELGLNNPDQFNVLHPAFFNLLSHLFTSIPMDDWKTYLRWNLVNATASDLSTPFVNAHFDFYNRTLSGIPQLPPRWKRVLDKLDNNAGDALGQLYVEKFFSHEAKTSVLEIVSNIKLAMAENIKQLDWMSPATKRHALSKLEKMKVKVGYPDQWYDLSTLPLSRTSYMDNNRNAYAMKIRRMLDKLNTPVNPNHWVLTAPTVNAYYSATMNEVVFPAGILQPPFYHMNADMASNYGSIGATIGHEIVHAFDNAGRHFDARGNVNDWWTEHDSINFIQRTIAIQQQFNAFNPIDQLHVDGSYTASENIADLGGLKIAFNALKKAQQRTTLAEKIDGFSPEQRFFIANAQSFRNLIRPQQLRLQILTDSHAPNYTRVSGPIANMPEFSLAFNCPADQSPLRPVPERVQIW